ncbi:hypothetical protein ACL02O_00800 [Micromonospora sp. MS34]|uniref:hypothetical protein n=1 Tax=Micromonospora sp. MS34 TaxID=3385971 RepID=UPI00399FF0B5
METVSGWILARRVRPFLDLLSRYLGYAFDQTDWETIALGLAGTDDEDAARWYDYPLGDRVTVWLAEADGSDIVSVRVTGLPDRDLALRAATLVDAYAHAD